MVVGRFVRRVLFVLRFYLIKKRKKKKNILQRAVHESVNILRRRQEDVVACVIYLQAHIPTVRVTIITG